MRKFLSAAAAAGIAVCASNAQAQEIYAHAGTLGAGLGAAYSLTTWAGVHAEVEGFGLSHSVTVDENKYDGHLSLKQGGVYLDLFPFRNSGFRVTGGALINDDELRAHAVPNAQGNYKIGDDFVPAVGAAPSAVAKLPTLMPYIGLGYGHKPVSKGFGFTFDIGAAYGRPHVDYNIPAIYSLFTSQDNILQAEQKVTREVEKYHWYPVVQLGISYRF